MVYLEYSVKSIILCVISHFNQNNKPTWYGNKCWSIWILLVFKSLSILVFWFTDIFFNTYNARSMKNISLNLLLCDNFLYLPKTRSHVKCDNIVLQISLMTLTTNSFQHNAVRRKTLWSEVWHCLKGNSGNFAFTLRTYRRCNIAKCIWCVVYLITLF